MKRPPAYLRPFGLVRAIAWGLALAATPALAAPGGSIATMPTGRFDCETPGDAGGPAVRRSAGTGFRLAIGSSYESEAGAGSYLMTGDVLTMTSGPFKGRRFRRETANALRELRPDGTDGNLRCVRRAGNNR